MQKIRIYRPPGREPEFDTFLLAQEPKLRRKLCRQLILLQQTPLCEWKEPHYKHFTLEKYNRLYELREKSRILVRIIFTIYDGDILLLVPFVKHQPRDTMRALEQSLRMLAEAQAHPDRLETIVPYQLLHLQGEEHT